MSLSKKPDKQYATNLALAGVAGQVGCFTLLIIFAALIGGLWLDKTFDARPLFTIILMVFSVPVTVVMMLWVVRKATSKIQPVPKDRSQIQEES